MALRRNSKSGLSQPTACRSVCVPSSLHCNRRNRGAKPSGVAQYPRRRHITTLSVFPDDAESSLRATRLRSLRELRRGLSRIARRRKRSYPERLAQASGLLVRPLGVFPVHGRNKYLRTYSLRRGHDPSSLSDIAAGRNGSVARGTVCKRLCGRKARSDGEAPASQVQRSIA